MMVTSTAAAAAAAAAVVVVVVAMVMAVVVVVGAGLAGGIMMVMVMMIMSSSGGGGEQGGRGGGGEDLDASGPRRADLVDVFEQLVQRRHVHHGLWEGLLGVVMKRDCSSSSSSSSCCCHHSLIVGDLPLLRQVQGGRGSTCSMSCSVAETVAVVMREGKHLLGQRVPDHRHETQTGPGAAGPGRVVVLGVVAVLVLLVLMVPQHLHVLDGKLRGGVGRGQAGQLAIPLRQRLNTGQCETAGRQITHHTSSNITVELCDWPLSLT